MQMRSTWEYSAIKRAVRMGAAVAAAVLALTACAGGASSTGGSADTLTYAASTTPTSLDPVVGNNNPDDIVYLELAYAPLLTRDLKGDLAPGLATKWGYVSGKPGTEFSLTLRQGAKFDDGSAVTAQAVANSLNYFIKNTTGPSAGAVVGLSARASGPEEVLLSSVTANPIIPDLLTSYDLLGLVVSPAGLAHPEKLKTETHGAGPYVYDAADSVSGDHYTYTANPNYYDKSAITAKKFVVKVIGSTNSALEALRSGQVDMMYGDQSLVSSAKSYGLQVFAQPHSFAGLMLADFGGTLVRALGDQRVRQALNYAIDRKAIAQAAVGTYGQATEQPQLPGWDSYSAALEDTYSYDPAKAKQLLSEAGYGNGFTMSVLYAAWEPADVKVVQAMAQQLSQVGIEVDLVPTSTGAELFGDLAEKKYSGFSLTWGGQPLEAHYGSLWAPDGSANPWKNAVPGLAGPYAAYLRSTPDTVKDAAEAAQKVIVDEAVTVPAVQVDAIALSRKGIKGFALDAHGVLTFAGTWSAGK